MSFPYSFEEDSSGVLSESYVDTFFNDIRNFTNQGIGRTELAKEKLYSPDFTHADEDWEADDGFEKDGYITSDRFLRPQIFGAPQARFIVPSGSVYWHSKPYGWTDSVAFQGDLTGANDFNGIPGACTRIKLRHEAIVNFISTFYCFEYGGLNNNRVDSVDYGGLESRPAGVVALKVNDTVYESSAWRYIHVGMCRSQSRYAEVPGNENGKVFFQMIGRHQHSISRQVKLNAGVHDIGLVFKAREQSRKHKIKVHYSTGLYPSFYGFTAQESPVFMEKKMIFFMNRNTIIDVNYVSNKD